MNYENIRNTIKKNYKKALVTGGAGFIGSHIVDELLNIGLKVISIDNYIAGKKENNEHNRNNENLEIVNCDITDYNELKRYFKDVDVIFNEAASKKNVCIKDPRMDLRVNGEGTFNILELARDNKVKKIVHASTGSVYGEARIIPQTESHPLEPVSYYGVSKLAGERYVKAFTHLYDMDNSILRYFHVYGPRQESGIYGGVVAIFIRNILEGKIPTIFGDGYQERSFTYVKDVVKANMFIAASKGTKGEVYNCASGVNITINELCESLFRIFKMGNKIRPNYKDWTIGDIKKFSISNKKLCDLGFEFGTNFSSGLNKTVDYYRNKYGKN